MFLSNHGKIASFSPTSIKYEFTLFFSLSETPLFYIYNNYQHRLNLQSAMVKFHMACVQINLTSLVYHAVL